MLPWNPAELLVAAGPALLGLAIGLAFGALAERSRFCFRRSLVGADRGAASGVWLAGLATALALTQWAIARGLIALEGNRLLAAELPLAAIVAGGLLFGAGMVMARGCISRLTVLSATGNLRAALTVLIVALVAHATMKGVLSPLREAATAPTLFVGEYASLAALPGGAGAGTLILCLGLALLVARSGARPAGILMGAVIGALVPATWVGTSLIAAEAFEPVAVQGLSFTSPLADAFFWFVAASSVPAGLGVGLVGGTLGGAFLSAALGGRLQAQGFASPAETVRYLAGGALMGFGGVVAGGCALGAGLSGVALLSVAGALALGAMALGGLVTNALLRGQAGVAVPKA